MSLTAPLIAPLSPPPIVAENNFGNAMLTSKPFTQLSASEIESITPYHVISLLLNGALSRINETMESIADGEIDQANLLIQKTIGIVSGLRENLDLSQGGDIASNLDTLYEYIVERLNNIDVSTPLNTLVEVKNLLQTVQEGWLGISEVAVQGAAQEVAQETVQETVQEAVQETIKQQ